MEWRFTYAGLKFIYSRPEEWGMRIKTASNNQILPSY